MFPGNQGFSRIIVSGLVGAALLPAFARGADVSPYSFDRLMDVVETRETHLDLDGDGAADLVRKFDGDGRVIAYSMRYPSGTEERYHEENGGRIRVTERLVPQGHWERVEEHWIYENFWTRRETLSGPTPGEPERKIVETSVPPLLNIVTYVKEGKGWRRESTRTEPLTHTGGSKKKQEAPAPAPEANPLPLPAAAQDIRQCPSPQAPTPPGEIGTCPWYSRLPIRPDRFDDLESVVPIECRNGWNMELNNGFRIDLTTCGASPARIEWARRLTQDMYAVMRCANTLNGDMGAQFANAISSRRPRIRCLQGLNEEQIRRACSEEPGPDSCAQTAASSAGGFQQSGSNNIILLRDTNPDEYDSGLPPLVVHELMHMMGVPHHEAFHNATPNRREYFNSLAPAYRNDTVQRRLDTWALADPVYGVQLMCGGSPPGSPPIVAESGPGMVDRWIGERGPIARPGTPAFIPPGNAFEVACTAFVTYRPSFWARYDLFSQSTVAPQCRQRSDAYLAAIQARETRLREASERRTRRTQEAIDAVLSGSSSGALDDL